MGGPRKFLAEWGVKRKKIKNLTNFYKKNLLLGGGGGDTEKN